MKCPSEYITIVFEELNKSISFYYGQKSANEYTSLVPTDYAVFCDFYTWQLVLSRIHNFSHEVLSGREWKPTKQLTLRLCSSGLRSVDFTEPLTHPGCLSIQLGLEKERCCYTHQGPRPMWIVLGVFSRRGNQGIAQFTTGKLISLSEQELVDYDTSGVDQADGTCDAKKTSSPAAKITGYEIVPANSEKALLKAVANQPIVVSIDVAGSAFQFYSSGVFNGECIRN
ncbi:hypothetical protein GIB67_022739 [Kingdonia uniflora]|uniref:Peptidase C1A papain C-terminal domain-containing protein n=1 Tax=Kingdonia uniflora TaxID=39325 RepID=A0A7J7L9X7_9MAGN|nr:hypothetical protein GIB67_022739 [Kingdonia uniflora]